MKCLILDTIYTGINMYTTHIYFAKQTNLYIECSETCYSLKQSTRTLHYSYGKVAFSEFGWIWQWIWLNLAVVIFWQEVIGTGSFNQDIYLNIYFSLYISSIWKYFLCKFPVCRRIKFVLNCYIKNAQILLTM